MATPLHPVAESADTHTVLRGWRTSAGMSTVFMPFGEEYKILLKNTNSRRCQVGVKIDGMDTFGGDHLVLGAHSEIDLERFVIDGDLSKGERFKFVSVDGPDADEVQDPTSSDNGLIEVTFQLEQPPIRFKGQVLCSSVRPRGVRGPCGQCAGFYDGVQYGGKGTSLGRDGSEVVLDFGDAPSMDDTPEQIGATVGGSVSNQGFVRVPPMQLETQKTVIKFRIRGHKRSITTKDTRHVFCWSCGVQNRYSSKFCTSCGAQLYKEMEVAE